ncbi:MAG TPA: MoaD/ThiS family protein [Planctomycetaceae bacterium]|nr:MoaD/ThiS family protein [Planctomycetaceae bacterium]HIQ22698.1 MoaD/ThiS family protein [Planctomycetota bacterium]
MPRVTVHLYASLRSYAGGAPSVEVEIRPGQTVEETLHALGIPSDQTRILFVNNRAAATNQPLQDGDRIGAFPAIGGG